MKSIEFRKNIVSSLLLAFGVVLYISFPPFFFGMKFDFLLTFILLAVLIHPTLINTYVIGFVGGLLEYFLTTFPGGNVPNFVDVIITVSVLYLIVIITKRFINKIVLGFIFGAVGTLISGSSFLYVALLMVGLPGSSTFVGLFLTVVLPTTIVNLFAIPFLYTVFERAAISSNNKLYEFNK